MQQQITIEKPSSRKHSKPQKTDAPEQTQQSRPPAPERPKFEPTPNRPRENVEILSTEDVAEPLPDYYTKVPTFGLSDLPSHLRSRFGPIDNLPTYYHYYDFKELKTRSFTTFDLIRINEARASKNRKLLLDVIASAIDQPLGDLTFGDFQYICYSIRLNSYTKSPLQVLWRCPNCEARYRKEKGIADDVSLPFNTETDMAFFNLDRIMQSNLSIVDMPKPRRIPDTLEVPRMRHFLAYHHMLEAMPYADNIANAALYVKGNPEYTEHDPDSFQGKLDTLNFSPDSLGLRDDAEALASLLQHGVVERINVRCQKGGCGARHAIPVETDLLTFFP